MFSFIDRIPVTFFIAICASLGLAPFFPEPHIVQKINMLLEGSLFKPVDIFDMVFHGMPWLLLIIKLSLIVKKSQGQQSES